MTTTNTAGLPELPAPVWCASDGVSPGVYDHEQVLEYGRACYAAALRAGPVAKRPAADLEQFRDCVIEARAVWFDYAKNYQDPERQRYCDKADEAVRLLDLIESQKENSNG